MIQFLAAPWLWALLSVTIPLLIHLLNRKSGKKTPFGSVQLLREAASHRLSKIKISQIPLLLVRCALLILLGLLLARPVWLAPEQAATQQPVRWILVEPEHFPGQHEAAVRAVIDSLRGEGYEMRAFAPGFPTLDARAELPSGGGMPQAWSLVRELDSILPPGSRAVVIAAPLLSAFTGQRPSIHFDLVWRSSGPTGNNHWIEYLRQQDTAFDLSLGRSDASATTFSRVRGELTIPDSTITMDGNPPVIVTLGEDSLLTASLPATDAFAGDNQLRAASRRKLRRIALFHDDSRMDDARYVRTALAVLSQTQSADYVVSVNPDTARGLPEAEIMIWLSPRPPPPSVMTWTGGAGRRLIADGLGDQHETAPSPVADLSTAAGSSWKVVRINAAPPGGIPILTNSRGQAVLQVVSIGAGLYFQFNSRFHPDWGDWIISAEFPEQLDGLLDARPFSQSDRARAGSDRRMIDPAQLTPRRIEAGTLADGLRTLNLHFPLMILIAAFLVIERWLSARRGA